MRSENTRTLNSSYRGKKSSKKSSKKNSKKNRNNNANNTTEEMMNLLDSDTEVYVPNKNNLVPYHGEVSQNQPMQGNFGQMGQMNNSHLQMYSPGSYDPLMLQQIAPLQTTQAIQGSGMPSNLLTPNNMIGNLAHLGKGSFNNNVDPMSGAMPTPMGGMPGIPGMPAMPNMPAMPGMPAMPAMPAMPGNAALGKLSMLGGGKRLI
jgi:hypothetical protein